MLASPKPSQPNFFEKTASFVAKASGSNVAITIAFSFVIAWIIWDPFASFSEQWQMVINTGTTIITFLMVFLIQKSQNKDALAIHLKSKSNRKL